jgi:flagellar hook-basal body complex protein FliE
MKGMIMDKVQISNGARLTDLGIGQQKTGSTSVSSFSDALNKAVNDVDRLQHEADKSIQSAQTGNTGSLHEAIIALEKADISFRTMLQVRNKLIDAYQEIMRMSV